MRHLVRLNEVLHAFRDFWYQVEERRAEEDASAEAKQNTHHFRRSTRDKLVLSDLTRQFDRITSSVLKRYRRDAMYTTYIT